MKTEEIDILLHEFLQEQKQIKETLSSFTRILMEVNGKLDNGDDEEGKDELKQTARTIQMAVESIPTQLSIPLKEIRNLDQSLRQYYEQLKVPVKQKVVHHVQRLWVLVAMFLIVIIIETCGIWVLMRELNSMAISNAGMQKPSNENIKHLSDSTQKAKKENNLKTYHTNKGHHR